MLTGNIEVADKVLMLDPLEHVNLLLGHADQSLTEGVSLVSKPQQRHLLDDDLHIV